MTAIPQNRMVSQRILDPLKQVARRQWSVLATRGVLLTLLVSLGVILAGVLILSLFPNVPLGARIAAAVIVWGAVLTSGVMFLRPAMRKRNLVQTAMDVESQLSLSGVANTHERITSSLELGQETDPRFTGSPSLVQHLMRQAEADAAVIRAQQVVPSKSVVHLSMMLIPLIAVWVAVVFWMPSTRFLPSLFSLLMPWQEPPGWMCALDVSQNQPKYKQGDEVQIKLVVNPDGAADQNHKVERAVIYIQPTGATEATQLQLLPDVNLARTFYYIKPAEKSFTYWVVAEGKESRKYQATVEPVPSVEQLQVTYEPPAYMQVANRIDTQTDGTIKDYRGTKVTLSFATNSTLLPASKLAITENVPVIGPDGIPSGTQTVKRDLTVTKAGDKYQAQFILGSSGSYQIQLVNEYNYSNPDKDRADRTIEVLEDRKPEITITSPTVPELTIRPDEKVPVAYQAADDFGIAKIQLIAQVDGGAELGFPVSHVTMGSDNKWIKTTTGKHEMSVKAILEQAKVADLNSHTISYRLRATDNRDPNPQSTDSSALTLKIDKTAETLAVQQEKQQVKDLIAAIKLAIVQLTEVKTPVAGYTWHGKGGKLTTELRKTAETLREKLESTSNDLVKTAEQNLSGPFAVMAAQAKQISEARILGAADAVAKIDVHSDQFDLRKSDTELATQHIGNGIKELKALLEKVEEQVRIIEAQRKIAELAKKQEELAKAMQNAAEKNQQNPQDKNAQQEVNKETQKAIEQAKLENKTAQKLAEAQQELIQKIEELEKQQQAAIEQNQKQAEANQAAEQAKTLAQKQEELNKKVEEFAKKEEKPLEKAAAMPPEQKALENIVKDLNAQKVQQAAQQQEEAANKLEENAKKLEQQAKAQEPQVGAEQQKKNEEAKAEAQKAEQAAQEAKKNEEQAKNANEQAKKAAEKAKEAAKKENKEEQKNAAQQAAEAAKQAAEQAKVAEKQAEKTQAKAEMAQKNPAAEAKAQENAKQAGEKAKQAQAAAKEAQAAAEKAQEAAKQAEKAAQEGNAEQQKEQTAKAGEKAQEAGEKANEAAQKAAEAAKQLAGAQKENAEGQMAQAKAQAKQQAQAAAEKAQALAQEQKALAQESKAQAEAMAQAQKNQPSPAAAAAQQQAIAQQTQKAAAQAQKLANAAKEANNPQMAQRAEQAQKALEQAQANQQEAAAAQKQQNNEQAAGAQEAAQNNLVRAEQALRGQMPKGEMAQANAQKPQGQKPEGQPGEQPPADPAAGEAAAGEMPKGEQAKGEPAKGEPGKGEPGKGEPGKGEPAQAAAAEPHPGEAGQPGQPGQGQPATPGQALAQAQQAAAEAMAAQQQAAQGNQAAAQQAAQALNQASQALAQAAGQPGQPGQPGQAKAPGKPGQEPGQEPGEESTPTPGETPDSKKGIAAQETGGSAEVPAAIAAQGVTPSEWAKFPPAERENLINAAKSNVPPEYLPMTINFSLRTARMHAQQHRP
jgi:hypothetical protein